MRAARLVVDPGLHVLGWSRQRAIDYMLAYVPELTGPDLDPTEYFTWNIETWTLTGGS